MRSAAAGAKKLAWEAQSHFVKVVEVGPRDGLQNEAKVVPTSTKIELINRLSRNGLKNIEVTSFVSPKWIPQMADNTDVYKSIEKHPKVDYSVLVPNLRGLESAVSVGANHIAIFGSASEAFTQRNINCSIADSIHRFAEVIDVAKEKNLKVRGYISCVVGCPYEGEVIYNILIKECNCYSVKLVNSIVKCLQIKSSVVAKLTEKMLSLGCYEVSLGDTIGVGTPNKFRHVLRDVKMSCSPDFQEIAMHCHDTYGQALVNVYSGLEYGVRTFDSSVAGLGGCPYAAGASGNLATEDLVYLLHGQGFDTGINLEELAQTGQFISRSIGRQNMSKVGNALLHKMNEKNFQKQ